MLDDFNAYLAAVYPGVALPASQVLELKRAFLAGATVACTRVVQNCMAEVEQIRASAREDMVAKGRSN